jgi:hypothetical protein
MRIFVLALVLALAACGGGGSSPDVPNAAPLAVVEIAGDSLAANDWPETTWQRDLEARSPQYRFVQAAKSGALAVQTPYLPAAPAGVYILVAGTNDYRKAEISNDQIMAALQALWAKARADGFKVVASTVGPYTNPLAAWAPSFEAKRQDLNARIRASAPEYDALIDLDRLFPNALDTTMLYDRLHFAPLGNSVVLDEAARILAELSVR